MNDIQEEKKEKKKRKKRENKPPLIKNKNTAYARRNATESVLRKENNSGSP
jgi:hypothetical protein